MPQKPLTYSEILAIVSEVSFMDRKFRVLAEHTRGAKPFYLIQLTYMEEDVDTGKEELQSARKWYVSAFSTPTEVVETCYAACLRSMKHVVREHFLYKGRRVMSPHFDIEARVELCDAERYDIRED